LLPVSTPNASNNFNAQQTVDEWAWTKVPVTGDNRVYSKVRKEIDTAVSQAGILRPFWKNIAERRSPRLATCVSLPLAYTAYVTAMGQSTSPQILSSIDGLSDPRYAVAPVESYDFNRVRFLIAALTDPNPALADLGRRLLAVNQDDDSVEYALAGILLESYNPPRPWKL